MNINTKNLIYNHKTFLNVNKSPHFSMKHSHTLYEIIFFEKGDADYIVEGRLYHLKKNDIIFTKPLDYHYITVHSNSEYARYNIAFNPDLVDKNVLDLIPKNLEVLNCPPKSIIAETFNKLDFYSENLDENAFIDILKCLLKEIFYNVSLNSFDINKNSSELSPFITQALNYINRELFTIKDVKDVCNYLHLSESYFFKLFKKQLKIPPKQYINLKRLNHAQKLIQSGHKPSEIYSECGFETYVGFYKQYVKQFGHSPSKETLKITND